MSANSQLEMLFLEDNDLTSIDISANSSLFSVDITNTNLSCQSALSLENSATAVVTHNACIDYNWVAGVYDFAEIFKERCQNPRDGYDTLTGFYFNDAQGSVLDENNWLRSWSNDLYLWYDEIEDVDPGTYASPIAYFDILKTNELTESGSPKDNFHSAMPTTNWLALSQSGISVGYGVTFLFVSEDPPREIVVAYTEPNSPATSPSAALERGARITALDGVDAVNGDDIVTIYRALFPAAEGESHEFTVQDRGSSATRTFTMAAEVVESVAVQNVGTIETDDGLVGYMLFNDHLKESEQLLVNAIAELEAANVDDLVLDIRYNGGGLLDIAAEVAYMIAGDGPTAGQTFERLQFNDKHTVTNPVTGELLDANPFHSTTQGFSTTAGEPLPTLDLSRLYVLTDSGTCSASEAVINSLRGIDIEVFQFGSTTCGKPYGFYPTDNCGTTYFSVQFQGVNAKGFGGYADGFSPSDTDPPEGVPLPGCSVADDLTRDLGDPEEARLAAALAYRATETCPAASATGRKMLRDGRDLSAVNGSVKKTIWHTNRILTP